MDNKRRNGLASALKSFQQGKPFNKSLLKKNAGA
jgi:hypothetical protein